MATRARSRLARLHRWLALALAPVLALVLLSGAVLALRPILGTPAGPPAAGGRVDPSRLVALLDAVDPRGAAEIVALDPSRRTAMIGIDREHPPTFYDVASRRVTAPPPEPARRMDVFDVARRVHVDLWIGVGGLVGLATVVMLVLVLLGPVLARPGRGATPLGRHIRAGWVLWPLVAMLPVSVAMMKLHRPIVSDRTRSRLALARAVETLAAHVDASRLRVVQALPGAAFVVIESPGGEGVRYVVRDGRVTPMETRLSALGRALHTGTLGGRWFGLVSLCAALASLWVMLTGLAAWWRRRARGGSARGDAPAARAATTTTAAAAPATGRRSTGSRAGAGR